MPNTYTLKIGTDAASASLDFFSDWSNATGTTDAAYLDGGKWDGYVGDSADTVVDGQANRLYGSVEAAPTGFPAAMSNVFRWEIPDYQDPDPQPGLQVKIENGWTIPAVGEYQFYRFYIRMDAPAGHSPQDQHFFHIGNDTGAAAYESCFWLNGIEGGSPAGSVGSSGEYRIQLMPNWQSTATSDTAWHNIYLTTTEVYRLELRAYRAATNQVRYALRVYDSSGTLRDASPSEQWFEYYGAQGWTTLDDFVLDITSGTAEQHFAALEIGYNGSSPTGAFDPVPDVYCGGVAIRVSSSADDWIGAYPVTGVED